MVSLSDKAEQIRKRELKRALGKLPNLEEEDKKIIENMTHMIIRKILREPMTRLNEYAGTEKEREEKQAVTKLFGLTSGKE